MAGAYGENAVVPSWGALNFGLSNVLTVPPSKISGGSLQGYYLFSKENFNQLDLKHLIYVLFLHC